MREESAERLMLPPRTPATGPRRQRSAGARGSCLRVPGCGVRHALPGNIQQATNPGDLKEAPRPVFITRSSVPIGVSDTHERYLIPLRFTPTQAMPNETRTLTTRSCGARRTHLAA